MFEQEIELEKKTSSIVPLLLIVVLILAVVGVALYFVAESKKVLTSAEAGPVVVASLESQPAPMLHFSTGLIKASVSDKPHDPHYRLLEKEGFLKIGKEDQKYRTAVSLTERGQAFLGEIAGVKQSKDKDGNTQYIVPLAQRKLVEVGKITMLTPSRAAVEYTWKWETTKAGDLYDAAGPAVKGFNTWDRSALIEKYGANFYHGDPTRITVAMVKTDKGWEISTE